MLGGTKKVIDDLKLFKRTVIMKLLENERCWTSKAKLHDAVGIESRGRPLRGRE